MFINRVLLAKALDVRCDELARVGMYKFSGKNGGGGLCIATKSLLICVMCLSDGPADAPVFTVQSSEPEHRQNRLIELD